MSGLRRGFARAVRRPYMVRRFRGQVGAVVALAASVVVLCAVAVVVVVGLVTLTRSALVSGLQAAGPQRSTITVSGLFQPSDATSPRGGRVGRVLRHAVAPVGGRVTSVWKSSTYDLPTEIGAGKSQHTTFWSVPNPGGQLRLVSGSWPAAAGHSRAGPVPVAVSAEVANQFDLAPGTRFTVRSRLNGASVRVVVTGVWAPGSAPHSQTAGATGGWVAGRLVRRGHTGDASFSTWGPLLVPRGRFAQVGSSGTVSWHAVPDWSGATRSQVARLRTRVATLNSQVTNAAQHRQHPASVQVSNPLPDVLASQERGLVVFRSLVLVPAGLVGAVALAGLLLTATLLAAARAPEEALRRSRGAGPWQLVRPTVAEAAVIGVLGVIIGPWLASGVLTWVWQPTRPGGTAWVAAAVTAAVCVVLLTAPSAVRAVRQYDVRTGADEAGPSRRALATRLAALVVLAALGVVAAEQLRRYGIAGGSGGALGLEALVVAAPAVVLAAGVVLIELGVVPLARTVAALADRARGLALLVGSHSVARDLARSLPVAIVVALAAGTATFATEQVASGRAARAARAAYVTGGDLQVPTSPASSGRDALDQWQALASAPGVAEATAVYRSTDHLQHHPVQTLAVDVSRLHGTALGPGALAGGLAPAVVHRLRSRPWRRGPLVPTGSAARTRVRATTTVGHIDSVIPVLADASGMPFPAGTGQSGKRAHAGTGARQLRLAAAVVTVDMPACHRGRHPPATATVRLTAVRAGGEALHPGAPRWLRPGTQSPSGPRKTVTVPTCKGSGSRTLVALFGHNAADVGDIPAVVTKNIAADLGIGVGDTFRESAFGIPLTVRVIGVRAHLATVDAPDGGVLVDAAAVVPRLLRAGVDAGPNRWWLTLSGRASASAVAHRVAGLPGVAQSVTTREQVRQRLDASSAAGGQGYAVALWVGAGVAIGLAGWLLAISTALRRRERRRRGALLQVLGVDGRSVLAALTWEHLLTALAGAAGGLALGTLVAWLMLDRLTLNAAGSPIVPPPSLTVAGGVLAILLIVLVVLPVLTVLLVARRDLGGADLTTVGREGPG